jgi:hypothetical protein
MAAISATYEIEQHAAERAEIKTELQNTQLALIRLSQDVRQLMFVMVPVAFTALALAIVAVVLVAVLFLRPVSASADSPSAIAYRLSAITRPAPAGLVSPRIALVRGDIPPSLMEDSHGR